jgi:hypothetical protein
MTPFGAFSGTGTRIFGSRSALAGTTSIPQTTRGPAGLAGALSKCTRGARAVNGGNSGDCLVCGMPGNVVPGGSRGKERHRGRRGRLRRCWCVRLLLLRARRRGGKAGHEHSCPQRREKGRDSHTDLDGRTGFGSRPARQVTTGFSGLHVTDGLSLRRILSRLKC